MPRKKKAESKEDVNLLSEQEVKNTWDVYQFAKAIQSGFYPGALSPVLLNQRLQDISLNPQLPDQTKLDSALTDPKNNEDYLQGVSQSFEVSSSVYKRLIEYLGTMLSFDVTYVPTNADKDDFRTASFKADEKRIEGFLDKFNYVEQFTTAIHQMIRSETFFCANRFDTEKFLLQELPSAVNWTKITGRWPYGLLFSLNLYWFIQPGVDIEMYPPFFASAYKKIWGTGVKPQSYIPSISPTMRGSSSWVYWQDIPVDVGHVFKMSPEIVARLPHYVGLFSDLILQPLMRNLQKSIAMAEATKIISGEVPFLNNTQAKVADQLSMNPETLGKFLGLVSSALSSAVKVVAAPLQSIGAVSFSGNNDLYPSYLRNTLAASGVNTGLIFTNAQRPNILESKLSLESDELLMTGLYPQFEAYMNYHGNKFTKKYKYSFGFEGTKFSTNREERWNVQKDLMERGIILPQKIASAIGMKPHVMRRMMEMADIEGFVDKLTPILQAAQMPSDGGRPAESETNLSDSGAETRETGGNEEKKRGGKVKK